MRRQENVKMKIAHIFNKNIHMKYKLKMNPEDVLEAIKDSIQFGKKYFDDIEWSCEDGTRSDIEFLYKCFDTAITSELLHIADTVGYTMPHEFQAIINNIRNNVPNIDKAVFSMHCHNDWVLMYLTQLPH